MTTFTRTWNTAYEALPPDSENASQGAQRIRNLRTDIRERLEVDHSYAGDTDDGAHKQVTFVDPLGAKPTQANDESYLYTKDVSATSELFYEDESGNEVQLTVGGKIEGASIDAVAVALIVGAINATQHGAHTDVTLHADATASLDGFATAAQITKLDGIESAATADQTGAEIKTLYEAEANAYTDTKNTKLSGIETSATADQTAAEIRTAVEAATDSNVFTDADHSKLNAIEASATADQSAAEILAALLTVDGSGSGLDADLLDGLSSAAFALSAAGVTNGDSHNHLGGDGAAIPEGGLAANAVDITSVKDTTGEVSAISATNITTAAGTHGFYPQTKCSSNSAAAEPIISIAGADGTAPSLSYITNIFLDNESGQTSYAQHTYMTASPPYNLGNGDIAHFYFLLLDLAGNILATYSAEDPPWAYNGPTSILPDGMRGGKKYQNQLLMPDGNYVSTKSPNFNALIKGKLTSPTLRDEWLDSIRNPTYKEVEIDYDIKNSDIGVIPHPFLGNDIGGKTVVMLDPIGDITQDLHDMFLHGVDVTDIIRNHINIDNSSNGANSPAGVMPVNISWK